jgi:hypothetical protein
MRYSSSAVTQAVLAAKEIALTHGKEKKQGKIMS